MNTAIEFKTQETPTQDIHVTAHDMELPFDLSAKENQHKLEWVCIRLTNPESLH